MKAINILSALNICIFIFAGISNMFKGTHIVMQKYSFSILLVILK